MTFSVYKGAGGWSNPLWQGGPGSQFALTNTVLGGEEIFFSVDSNGSDVNGHSYWEDLTLSPLNPGRIVSPIHSGLIIAGDTLRFTAEPAPTAGNSYLWSFGDGRQSLLQAPGNVSAPASGPWIVTLWLTNILTGVADVADVRLLDVAAVDGAALVPDFVAMSLSVPANLAIGQPTAISYTVRNSGDGSPTNQSWKDALYLSSDPYLDTEDRLLVSATVSNNLAVGGSYTNTLTVTLSSLAEGAYYLLLSVNDEWQFLERHRMNNEFAVPTYLVIPRLTNAVPFVGTFSGNGDEHIYRIDVPAGQNLLIRLNGLDNLGVSEVYVRFGALPTRGTFDYRAATPGSADQQTLISAAAPGTYYIMVRGESVPGNGQFTLEAIASQLSLTGVVPDHLANTVDAYLTLSGAGFDATTRVALVSTNGMAYSNNTVSVDSFTQLTVTIPANSVPPGLYTVRVSQPGGAAASLTNAFTMVPAGQASLATSLIVPSSVGYHGLATHYIEFANTGNAAMPAPLLVLRGLQQGTEGAWLTLDATRLSQGFWTSAQPEGFSHSVQVLASGGTPGVLQPGESFRVPVYYAGWQQPWNFSYPPIEWQLGVIKADDTTAVNWADFKANMKPASINPEAWDALWANFVPQVGSTWGGYVRMLDDNAAYLGRLGERVLDLGELLAFEFMQADGLNPMRSLAGAVDAAVEAPGLPVTFARSLAQSISRRYEVGPFGRGWSHNWQYTFSQAADGTVTITGPGGSRRTFQPDTRAQVDLPAGIQAMRPALVHYFATSPGEHGTLWRLLAGGFVLQESNGLLSVYRPDGRLDYMQDLNGNRITAGYSGAYITSLTHSSGGSLQIAYNGAGFIQSVTDPVGRQTLYTYAGDHLTQVQQADGRTTTYTYGTGHALVSISGSCCSQRSFTYDAQGRLASTWVGQNEATVTFAYDNAGGVTARDALANTSRFYFDHRGLMVKSENALGHAVHMNFDDNYNLTQVTDPAGRSYRYAYDSQGNLTASTDPLGGTTRFTFASLWNRLSSVTDAKGNGTRYSYTPQGNLQAITYADGSVEHWAYNAAGLPTCWTNRRGHPITYTFGTNGQLLAKNYPVGTNAVYEYNARGNLVAASNEASRQVFTYDANDRLVRIDYPFGPWLQFTYNEAGKRASSLDQLGHRLNYYYDSAGRLESMNDENGKRVVLYTYNAAGHLARKEVGNGMYTTYACDPAGQVLHLVNTLSNNTVISRFDYTYDSRGRRTSMDTLDGKWDYGYDDLGQLTRAVFASRTNDIPNQDLTYIYDALGNRVRTIENGVTNEYTANNMNQYTRTVASNGRTTAYTFDADGNLVSEVASGGGQSATTNLYTFNTENKIASAMGAAGFWWHTYDPLGRTVAWSDAHATNLFVIDPIGFGDLVGEYDAGGNEARHYVYGRGLVAQLSAAPTSLFYAYDELGNAQQLVGLDSTVVNRYAYEPFGRYVRSAEGTPNAFGLGGQFGIRSHGDSHDMRHRLYNPKTGRFITGDPIGIQDSEVNLYRYVGNSPTLYLDPRGLELWDPHHRRLNGQAICRGGRCIIEVDSDLSECSRHCVVIHEAREIDWRRNHPGGDPNTGEVEANLHSIRCLLQCNDRDKPALMRDFQKNMGDALAGTYYPPGGGGTSSVSGSTDPNQKTGPAGFGAAGFVTASGAFAYRVDFENQPTATAPAQQVVITDQLSTNLDWTTLELAEVGFGDQLISIPPHSQHFESTIAITYSNVTFDVQIEAGVRLGNGQLYATFYSINPSNGLPPTVDIGFLPPEDGTGRGMGHLSYTVRPKANLSTGTQIRNVAVISFDNQAGLATDLADPHNPGAGSSPTKQCLNTIDSGAPATSVQPLPAYNGHSFVVQWGGNDAGSGIASYDVFVSTNGIDFKLWVAGTNRTSAIFTGELGRTYAFNCRARDWVGNEEAAHSTADTFTTISTNSPVLAAITNQTLRVGSLFGLTNSLLRGAPTGSYVFSLQRGPTGLTVGSTNGVVRWTPACGYGSTTNRVTVWVTDRVQTNLADAVTFNLIVGECLEPQLGTLILPVGQRGRLPVNLITSEPLTNLMMTLNLPAGRLIDPSIEIHGGATNTIAGATVEPASNLLHHINLASCANAWMYGTQQVAWVYVTAASNQHSAFLKVKLYDSVGSLPDGTLVTNLNEQLGRVVVIGEEPLLEIFTTTNRQPSLTLYGKAVSGYSIEWRTNLLAGKWLPVLTNLTIPANLFLNLNAPPAVGPKNYYRAKRIGAVLAPRIQGLARVAGTNVLLSFSGVSGQSYRVQVTPTLSPPAWQNIGTGTPGGAGFVQFADTNGWGLTQRFYRLVWP
jgi:RHS repeat-associated protein